mmetsp:Transcript_21045/g.48730  ORF Transcript_21045/g.48730 Transcript_21045/m.48730 type:complete len:211 (+) Transcript_21045:502-1134(+)
MVLQAGAAGARIQVPAGVLRELLRLRLLRCAQGGVRGARVLLDGVRSRRQAAVLHASANGHMHHRHGGTRRLRGSEQLAGLRSSRLLHCPRAQPQLLVLQVDPVWNRRWLRRLRRRRRRRGAGGLLHAHAAGDNHEHASPDHPRPEQGSVHVPHGGWQVRSADDSKSELPAVRGIEGALPQALLCAGTQLQQCQLPSGRLGGLPPALRRP